MLFVLYFGLASCTYGLVNTPDIGSGADLGGCPGCPDTCPFAWSALLWK